MKIGPTTVFGRAAGVNDSFHRNNALGKQIKKCKPIVWPQYYRYRGEVDNAT